jgi:NitT/TauT family transport system substrate-binding protein
MEEARRDMLETMGSAAVVASSAAAVPTAIAGPATGAQPTRKSTGKTLKVRVLNSGLSGPHAFFCLAKERGYFDQANLDVEFLAGEGASASVPATAQEGYQAGSGGPGSLVKLAAMRLEYWAAPETIRSAR